MRGFGVLVLRGLVVTIPAGQLGGAEVNSIGTEVVRRCGGSRQVNFCVEFFWKVVGANAGRATARET